jgi:hypothetical protein
MSKRRVALFLRFSRDSIRQETLWERAARPRERGATPEERGGTPEELVAPPRERAKCRSARSERRSSRAARRGVGLHLVDLRRDAGKKRRERRSLPFATRALQRQRKSSAGARVATHGGTLSEPSESARVSVPPLRPPGADAHLQTATPDWLGAARPVSRACRGEREDVPRMFLDPDRSRRETPCSFLASRRVFPVCRSSWLGSPLALLATLRVLRPRRRASTARLSALSESFSRSFAARSIFPERRGASRGGAGEDEATS